MDKKAKAAVLIILMISMEVILMLSLFGCGKIGQVMETDDEDSTSGGKTASLSSESFDGGGPEFNVVIAEEGIVSYDIRSKYEDQYHEKMRGSGYDEIITFTGIKQVKYMGVYETGPHPCG